MRLEDIFLPHGVECVGVASMDDLPVLLPVRSRGRIPPQATSVIVCLFPYYVGPHPRRNLSRYALLPDYHQICGAILDGAVTSLVSLFPDHCFVPFVDASPIPEVEAARLAGLGVVGQNGQLIHPRYGSYVFIGEIVTDLYLPPCVPRSGGCLGCGKCLKACPTGALRANAVVSDLCRSHITQKKGALTPWERAEVLKGGLAWGCDICTDCCPHNKNPVFTPISSFYQNPLSVLSAKALPTAMANRAFNFRGEKVLRRNLEILAEAGESGAGRFAPGVECDTMTKETIPTVQTNAHGGDSKRRGEREKE